MDLLSKTHPLARLIGGEYKMETVTVYSTHAELFRPEEGEFTAIPETRCPSFSSPSCSFCHFIDLLYLFGFIYLFILYSFTILNKCFLERKIRDRNHLHRTPIHWKYP